MPQDRLNRSSKRRSTRHLAEAATPSAARQRSQPEGPAGASTAERPSGHDVAVQWLPLGSINASQRNPRRKMSGIDELAASLDSHGLLQPVLVRPAGNGFELVAGHRRFLAAKQLNWEQIPAIVRTETDTDAYLLTLVENLQREDLTAREEADALEILVRQLGWSTRQVATAIHRSQAFVSKRLRVFEDTILAPVVLNNQVSVSIAEELLTAPERMRYDLLTRAISEGWDRAQVRRAVSRGAVAARAPRSGRGLSRRTRALRMELRDIRIEGLSESDRRELRLLFQVLAMLAKSRPGAARVFPQLPSVRAK